MTIIIGADPSKALDKIDGLEQAIKRKLGKSVKNLDLNRFKQAIAEANEIAMVEISEDVVLDSPTWSYYLASNWEAISGLKPSVKAIPEPTRQPGKFQAATDEFWINSFNIDGRRPIYIYNDAPYGGRVAQGDFPAQSANSDWYLSIEQYHASGNYYLKALEIAKQRYDL